MRRRRGHEAARWVLGDSVDRMLDEWAVYDRELDLTPAGVINRLARLRAHLESGPTVFAACDLSAADYAVISALRRTGPPYQLAQSALMNRLGLTSGTVSVRLTRLVGKGLVSRAPSPDDARGAVITLTERGRELCDQVAPAQLHNDDVLLSALTTQEQEQLAGLLRRLLVGFEQEHASSPLGIVLAPAHLARGSRTAVGLSDTPGLLVTQVLEGTPAADAGVQVGDVLVAVDRHELRSSVALAEHTAKAAYNRSRLTLTALRGSQQVDITLLPAG